MANSDPPVSIPPVSNGELVISALGPRKGELRVTVTAGMKLKLIVTREEKSGVTRFEIPIDEGKWKLDIVEVK